MVPGGLFYNAFNLLVEEMKFMYDNSRLRLNGEIVQTYSQAMKVLIIWNKRAMKVKMSISDKNSKDNNYRRFMIWAELMHRVNLAMIVFEDQIEK